MGVRVGKQKDNRAVSGLSVADLKGLIERGGRDAAKAQRELNKRGV